MGLGKAELGGEALRALLRTAQARAQAIRKNTVHLERVFSDSTHRHTQTHTTVCALIRTPRRCSPPRRARPGEARAPGRHSAPLRAWHRVIATL